MALDDEVFLAKMNDISRRHRLSLPTVKPGDLPSSAFLEVWARFLEDCVRNGLALSDERWQRLTVTSRAPHAVFALEGAPDASTDPDFRVGLKLLLGLLGGKEEEE